MHVSYAPFSATYLETDPKNQFTLCINHNFIQSKSTLLKKSNSSEFELGPLVYSCVTLGKFISSVNC